VPVSELPLTGLVMLRGVPSLATVTINGDTQSSHTVEVEPGSNRIVVTKAGHDTFTTTVPVRRGDTVRVPVVLNRLQVAAADTQPTRRRPPPRTDFCSDPVEIGADYNRDNRCFDVRPAANAAPLVPVNAGIADQDPTPVVLWVKIGTDGAVQEIKWVRQSSVRQFTIQAARYAQNEMTYTAATKDGDPVEGWLRLGLRARRQ
jgi:hypothetical protein